MKRYHFSQLPNALQNKMLFIWSVFADFFRIQMTFLCAQRLMETTFLLPSFILYFSEPIYCVCAHYVNRLTSTSPHTLSNTINFACYFFVLFKSMGFVLCQVITQKIMIKYTQHTFVVCVSLKNPFQEVLAKHCFE